MLDFLIIGAQKGGTTSLWQYLREHEGIYMPIIKELAIFSRETESAESLTHVLERIFEDAPPGSLRGKATPDYMIGQPGVPVEVVAERIGVVVPDAMLIAVLRDPIERAVSSYMMAVRRGEEKRPVDAALTRLLEPAELEEARRGPTPISSYIVAGEYGRVLGAYDSVFPRGQLLVIYTEELGADPGGTLDRILGFLGLPPGFRPPGLGVHHFRGGTRKLLDPESERLLLDFHRTQILPHMRGSATVHRKAFEFFYETWNVAVDDAPPTISAGTRARLESHFRQDAELLAELNVDAPWIDRWESDSAPSGSEGQVWRATT